MMHHELVSIIHGDWIQGWLKLSKFYQLLTGDINTVCISTPIRTFEKVLFIPLWDIYRKRRIPFVSLQLLILQQKESRCSIAMVCVLTWSFPCQGILVSPHPHPQSTKRNPNNYIKLLHWRENNTNNNSRS